MKFLKKLNPFKHTPVEHPVTLKDFVQQEKEAASFYKEHHQEKSFQAIFDDALADEQPESSHDEDDWRTACTNWVEFILFNANAAYMDGDDTDLCSIDFGSRVLVGECLENLQVLQQMLIDRYRNSDTEITVPDLDTEDYDE